MSHIVTVQPPEAGPDPRTDRGYAERARALIAEHAELFRRPVIRHSQRSLAVVAARPAPRRSPQLRLPLRPTMRR
ncbi:MAG: hypothetical protein E6I33_10690 [Chloroflexi bacterium]|nr:MAG: hypothetical protein E6I55_04515 [Chloroflexota bacterium]TMF13817.1 MAG: hypothetical protein E6I33_10690 [Chloroflexota bacterium]